MNIAQKLLATIRFQRGMENCLYQSSTGTEVTGAAFLERILRRQKDLADSISADEMVVITSGRGLDFFIDLFTVWTLGAVAVPYSPEDGPDHLKDIKRISGAHQCLDQLLTTPSVSLPATLDEISFIERKPGQPCAVLFTSGSTGTPKGVVLSQKSLLNNAIATHAVTQLDRERLFVNVPFHFTSAICHFLSVCLSSSTFIGSEKKLIYADFVDRFIESDATALGGAPVQIRWLTDATQANALKINKALRFCFSSGDHLSPDVAAKFCDTYPGARLYPAYGLTELGGRFCIHQPGQPSVHPGSVGKPIPGLNVEIFDLDSRSLLPSGEEGMIVASGELIANGYLNNPGETRATFRNGKLYTGDLGFLDENGFLYVVGRADDVFKVNGKKVSSRKIEAELMHSRYFLDVAVVGYDLPVFGTVPIACVVASPEREFHRGLVLKHLRSALPNSHIPHDFILVGEIPRTGSGKLKRAALKALIESRNIR